LALFGTNGVRGIVNKELTPELALKLARSLTTFIFEKNQESDPGNESGKLMQIAVGTDTRISGMMLKSAAVSGILSSGAAVIDIGIVPTPSLQYYVKNNHEIDAGIIITASHNPREYNGIKIIAGDGTEFSRESEKRVEEILNSEKFIIADWSKTGNIQYKFGCNEKYLADILLQIDKTAVEDRKFRVVTDTGSGAGSLTLPELMTRLGCKVLALGAQPDGTFPWRNPEPLPDALKEMITLMKNPLSEKFDLGIAHDGDADRAVFIDENGDFIDEEVMLAAIEKYVLQKEKGPVVTTVATSGRFTDVAKDAGVPIYYTPVGSIDVGRKMAEVGAVYGGEGNGGMIFAKHQICRDGAMAAAVVLEMLAKTGMKASELKKTVPVYFNEKEKIHFPSVDLKKKMAEISKKVEADKKKIDYESVETIDGLKLWFKAGWILIRPSGTEPMIRIVAEAKTKEDAEKYLKIGKQYVEN
jgi:phosphoglucosamine mutase